MKEYRVILDFEINSCTDCPFRHEKIFHENVTSVNLLSGTMSITRIESYCPFLKEKIDQPHIVDRYNTKCPLKKYIVNTDT